MFVTFPASSIDSSHWRIRSARVSRWRWWRCSRTRPNNWEWWYDGFVHRPRDLWASSLNRNPFGSAGRRCCHRLLHSNQWEQFHGEAVETRWCVDRSKLKERSTSKGSSERLTRLTCSRWRRIVEDRLRKRILSVFRQFVLVEISAGRRTRFLRSRKERIAVFQSHQERAKTSSVSPMSSSTNASSLAAKDFGRGRAKQSDSNEREGSRACLYHCFDRWSRAERRTCAALGVCRFVSFFSLERREEKRKHNKVRTIVWRRRTANDMLKRRWRCTSRWANSRIFARASERQSSEA